MIKLEFQDNLIDEKTWQFLVDFLLLSTQFEISNLEATPTVWCYAGNWMIFLNFD